MNINKTIPYTVWLILLFLWIILLCIFPPDVFPANFYTVQKGDTLSGIAKGHLGSWRKWKDLAEWNELKVEWKRGVPRVLIRPGQKIRLESQWTEEKIASYRLDTKRLLEKEIFRMIDIITVPNPTSGVVIHLPDILSQYDLRVAQTQMRDVLRDLANRERLLIAEEIFEYSALMPLHFFRDRPWIAERKTAILLMAIMTTESHGRFVRGKHGERGIYQIKPETFRIAMGYKREDLPEIEELLMTSHYAGMKCAIKLLKRGSSPYDALRRYNAGADGKDRAYALRVLRIFYEMMERGE